MQAERFKRALKSLTERQFRKLLGMRFFRPKKDKTSKTTDSQCAICLETFDGRDRDRKKSRVTLNCDEAHQFHF